MSEIESISSKMYANIVTNRNTAIKLGVGVIIVDKEGRILLEKRSDNGMWGIPGGAIEPGESVINAVIREVKEDTNLDIEIDGLLGIYSEPSDGRIVTYSDNGDVRHLVDVVFTAVMILLQMKKSNKSLDLKFYQPDLIPSSIVPPAIQPICDYTANNKKFVIR